MIYDITKRLKEAWEYYDKLLDQKLAHISELSGVPVEKMRKINPAEFIAKNKWQNADGHVYVKVWDWLIENKKDDTYCISPIDDDIKTADQIAYKEKVETIRIRGSKCQLLPINCEVATDFYLRNHRQVLPKFTHLAINYGLVYNGELVGAMSYDKTSGAVRGSSKAEKYELLRLAFAKKSLSPGEHPACKSIARRL